MSNKPVGGKGAAWSKIGFGAWGIGGETPGATSYGNITDKDAEACIKAALAQGITFFDTSPVYGYGRSEARLGAALGSVRENVMIATKGGLHRYDRPANFGVESLKIGLKQSLERLRTDYVDIYQLHNPPRDIMKTSQTLAAHFDELKKQGVARKIGISVKSPDHARTLLESYPFDTVQTNFNMMDVRAYESGLLDLCENKNIGVLARTPLCFGFLSLTVNQDTKFSMLDHRANWSKKQLALWSDGAIAAQKIAAQYDPIASSPAARAIRFCLLHPAVKTVLTGPMNAAEATENASVALMPPLGGECFKDILVLNQERSFFARP